MSSLGPSLVFGKLTENEYGFREKYLDIKFFNYTPIIYGHILFDPLSNMITITARLYWSAIILPVGFAAGFSMIPVYSAYTVFIIPFFILLFSFVYFVQIRKFKKVSDFIEKKVNQIGHST